VDSVYFFVFFAWGMPHFCSCWTICDSFIGLFGWKCGSDIER